MHSEEGEEGATHHANVSVKGALDISQAQRNCANIIASFYNEGSAFTIITRQYSHIRVLFYFLNFFFHYTEQLDDTAALNIGHDVFSTQRHGATAGRVKPSVSAFWNSANDTWNVQAVISRTARVPITRYREWEKKTHFAHFLGFFRFFCSWF